MQAKILLNRQAQALCTHTAPFILVLHSASRNADQTSSAPLQESHKSLHFTDWRTKAQRDLKLNPTSFKHPSPSPLPGPRFQAPLAAPIAVGVGELEQHPTCRAEHNPHGWSPPPTPSLKHRVANLSPNRLAALLTWGSPRLEKKKWFVTECQKLSSCLCQSLPPVGCKDMAARCASAP